MTINQYKQYIQSKGWDDRFRYMLLDRMRSDCNYYLGNGRFYGNNLWAGNVPDQIGYMKALWESFPKAGKPEWLTMEQIVDYERRMLHLSTLNAGRAQAGKAVVGHPINGISINSDLEFILDGDGTVRYFDSIEQAKEVLCQDGVREEDMGLYIFLGSFGTCSRCGAPLFPSLIEGYDCQCFNCDKCDKDFHSFEHTDSLPQNKNT